MAHTETTKPTDKTEAFLSTFDDRVENQVKFRRYVAQIALRSPLLRKLREYTDFDLSALAGAEMKLLREHLTIVLPIST